MGIILVSLLATPACGMVTAFAGQEQLPLPVVHRPDSDLSISPTDVLTDLARANVVYLAETHDNPADHAAQLYIIQHLYQQLFDRQVLGQQLTHQQPTQQQFPESQSQTAESQTAESQTAEQPLTEQPLTHQQPKLAIAMEMFQRPFQPVLDQYLAGEITDVELRQRSEYDERWGFPWDYYLPILEFARSHQVPVIAANTPAEITSTVAQEGLTGLSAADWQWIPPASEIRTDNENYRQWIRQIFDNVHQGHSMGDGFENFFLAQVLWDETMAGAIAQFLIAHPDYHVVVLAGKGHVVYNYGIPDRVARRLSAESDWQGKFSQTSVFLNPSAEELNSLPSSQKQPVADFFWTHPAP